MTSSSSSSPEIRGTDSQDRFSYKLATHEEVLDDLSSRFILNLPDDELSSLERICFQVEQAHWFYEDFIREENPKFPSLPLKKFSEMLFQACPLLQQWSHDHELAYTNFMQYKTRVPVCGAIMLNNTWEKVFQCLLVKGWKASSGWGFPKGKINQVEPPANCAIREVLEETGYNLAGQLNPDHVIEMSIREQKISLFIVSGVPEDYPFKTKTRKEISKIEWFRLADLPTWKRNKTSAGRFYLISPFIGPLKAFISENRPRPPRKVLKSKKAQPSVSRDAPTYSTVKDVTHQLSSHSSSAENGKPHSTSPQYSKPYTTLSPQISDEGSPIATIDPHFANLLSALANSASKHGAPPLNAVFTSNSPSFAEPKDTELTISVPAASRQETSLTTFQSSLTEPTSPESLSRVSQPHFSTRVPVDTSVAYATIPVVVVQSAVSPQPSQLPKKFSPTSSTMGSTSDGGLSKQHIALLDAVSKESARMQEAYKSAAATGVPINDSFLNPIIATTALPSSLAPRSHAETLNYAASTGSAPPSFINSHTMNSSQCYERPKTSLVYRSDLSNANVNIPGNASMNQSQLLALLNGSPTYPPMLHTGHPLPTPSQPPLLTPYRALVSEPQRSPFAPQLVSTLSTRSLASVPMISSHKPVPALPAASSTLLSILNSEKSKSQFSDLPPYSSNLMRE